MKRKISAICLALISICCLFFSFKIKPVSAYISDTPYLNVDEISKPYTDSDTFEFSYGEDPIKTIFGYEELHNNVKAMCDKDDPITKIIPKELFMHRGEYFHVGNEYGFYVHTRKNNPNQSVDNTSNITSVPRKSNLVTVFVFDVKTLFDKTTDQVQTAIVPLFCYDYVYILKDQYTFANNWMFLYWQPYYDNWTWGDITNYQMAGFAVENGLNDIVKSIPDARYYTNYEGEHFDEMWQQNGRYAMKDVTLLTRLANEDRPNVGDSNYVLNNDNGAFFIENGIFAKSGHSTNLNLNWLRMGLSYVKYVGEALDFVDLVITIINDVADIGLPKTQPTKEEDVYINQLNTMRTSAEAQREDYGMLLKDAVATLSNNELNNNYEIPFLLYPSLDYNESISYVNDSQEDQLDSIDSMFIAKSRIGFTNLLKTRIANYLQFSIVFKEESHLYSNAFRTVATNCSPCGDPLIVYGENHILPLYQDTPVSNNIMVNGSHEYNFVPQTTGLFDFDTNSTDTRLLLSQGQTVLGECQSVNGGRKLSVGLMANQTYRLKIYLQNQPLFDPSIHKLHEKLFLKTPYTLAATKNETAVNTIVLNDALNNQLNTSAIEYGGTYILPTPTKTDYRFDGWICNGVLYQGGQSIVVTSDMVFESQYTPFTWQLVWQGSALNASGQNIQPNRRTRVVAIVYHQESEYISDSHQWFLIYSQEYTQDVTLESGDLPVAGIVLSDGTVIGAEHFEELPSIGYAMQMFSVHNYTTLIAEVYQYFA